VKVITIEAAVTECRKLETCYQEYVKRQKGKCYHCSGPLDQDPPASVLKQKIDWGLFPPHFLRYPVHLHHDHYTGITKGAVHAYCNAVLWQYYGE